MSKFIGQPPVTEEDREKWPYGEPPPIPMGISSGYMFEGKAYTPERWTRKPMNIIGGYVIREAITNAVMVEIVDGKPVVSVLVIDPEQKPALEDLARQIIRAGIGEAE